MKRITSLFMVLVVAVVSNIVSVPVFAEETINSANYTKERCDSSWYNSDGELKLLQYYDKITLDDINEKTKGINALLEQNYNDFLATTAESAEYVQAFSSANKDYYYINTVYSDVTCNTNGIFSLKQVSVWYMGGVRNESFSGESYNLNTGEKLKLTEIFNMSAYDIEEYLKQQAILYINSHPERGWYYASDMSESAIDIVNAYTLEQFNFYVENNNIVLCFPVYELGPGVMGSVKIACPIINPIVTEKEISVLLDGEKIEFDQSPIMSDSDRVMVPIRAIFEKLGYTVLWNEGTQSIVATNPQSNKYISMVLDNPYIIICPYDEFAQNGNNEDYIRSHTQSIDQSPIMVGDRVLVPVRVIGEASGLSVEWDEAEQKVIISTDENLANTLPEVSINPQILGWWLHCDDYTDGKSREAAINLQLNADGTAYIHDWYGDYYCSYTFDGQNKITIHFNSYSDGSEVITESYFDGENLILMTSRREGYVNENINEIYTHQDKFMTYDDITQIYYNSCYDATNEINQIRSYIEQGLYLEAMQLCDEVKGQHILSEVDISVIDSLYETASYGYNGYLEDMRLREIALGALNYAQAFFGEQFELHENASPYDEEFEMHWIYLYWPNSPYNSNTACTIEYHPSTKQYYIHECCEYLMNKMGK